jgi:hypothetical protein
LSALPTFARNHRGARKYPPLTQIARNFVLTRCDSAPCACGRSRAGAYHVKFEHKLTIFLHIDHGYVYVLGPDMCRSNIKHFHTDNSRAECAAACLTSSTCKSVDYVKVGSTYTWGQTQEGQCWLNSDNRESAPGKFSANWVRDCF